MSVAKRGSAQVWMLGALLWTGGCRVGDPMGTRNAPQPGSQAEVSQEPAPRSSRAPRASGAISERVLAERGLMSLWTKSPQDREGPFRSAFLLPDGIFAVSRPKADARAWLLIRYGLDDGLPRWFYPLDEPLEHPPVTYHYGPSPEGRRPDELFILQKDVLRCLDLQYGAEMWRVQLPFPVSCAPVVDEGQYYLGSHDRRIYAMPKKKIVETWSHITGGEIRSPGVLGPTGEIYFTSTDRVVYRFQPTTGWIPGKSWQFATGSRITGSPVFFSRWIFVGSTDFKLYSFEPDGTRAWEFPAESAIPDTPVVMSFRPDKPMVFCISEDERGAGEKRTAWAVDVKTGQEVWHRGQVQQVAGIGRRAVYVVPQGGARRILALDALKGEELFSLPVEPFDIIPLNDADHGVNSRARGILYLIAKSGLMQAIREKP